MPLTWEQAVALEDESMNIRQVTENAVSCHGSHVSSKSHAIIARSKLRKAQLRERLLEQVLELEIQELVARKRRELLLAKSATEMARIDVVMEEQQRIKKEAELNKRSQIDRYKTPCDLLGDLKSFASANLEIENLMVRPLPTLSAVVDCLDLSKMESASFVVEQNNYRTSFQQFEMHDENKVTGDELMVLKTVDTTRLVTNGFVDVPIPCRIEVAEPHDNCPIKTRAFSDPKQRIDRDPELMHIYDKTVSHYLSKLRFVSSIFTESPTVFINKALTDYACTPWLELDPTLSRVRLMSDSSHYHKEDFEHFVRKLSSTVLHNSFKRSRSLTFVSENSSSAIDGHFFLKIPEQLWSTKSKPQWEPALNGKRPVKQVRPSIVGTWSRSLWWSFSDRMKLHKNATWSNRYKQWLLLKFGRWKKNHYLFKTLSTLLQR